MNVYTCYAYTHVALKKCAQYASLAEAYVSG